MWGAHVGLAGQTCGILARRGLMRPGAGLRGARGPHAPQDLPRTRPTPGPLAPRPFSAMSDTARPQPALVVAISSRALFDFEEENQVFEQQDDLAYMQLQLSRLDSPAAPGVAFPLVRKLLDFNQGGQPMVEVVLLSRNDPISGLRAFRSAQHYGLHIERGVFTRGRSPFHYLAPLQAHLFLSANEADVRHALEAGVPAARVLPRGANERDDHPDEIRIAFDGDAVLFSDQAEQVYKSEGLQAFRAHEKTHARVPLPAGPFKPLLEALHRLQAASGRMSLRTALVTARGPEASERAIRTLMDWQIELDEAFFLGGKRKSEFLQEFQADFFFDDQVSHIQHAAPHVPSGHVASGVANAAPSISQASA